MTQLSLTAYALFQFTRPRGARPAQGSLDVWHLAQFQFTRPRGARHVDPPRTERERHVSIHAPARGATLPRLRAGRRESVSIHAPARGAT